MYNFEVLPIKSDMSDMRKTSTCHLDVLIFSGLCHACNECNVFSKVEKIWYNLTLKESQRIHENYPKKKAKILDFAFWGLYICNKKTQRHFPILRLINNHIY